MYIRNVALTKKFESSQQYFNSKQQNSNSIYAGSVILSCKSGTPIDSILQEMESIGVYLERKENAEGDEEIIQSDPLTYEVKILRERGLTIRAISLELKVSKSRIGRIVKDLCRARVI